MGIRDRVAKANEAARKIRDEGADERRSERETLKSEWRESRERRATSKQENQDRYQAKRDEIRATRDASRSRPTISSVGSTEDGLRCPKCGGSQFTAKRSVKGKVIGVATVGVGAVLAPKSQVKCVTCGTMYRRG